MIGRVCEVKRHKKSTIGAFLQRPKTGFTSALDGSSTLDGSNSNVYCTLNIAIIIAAIAKPFPSCNPQFAVFNLKTQSAKWALLLLVTRGL